jgi:DNA polymerase-1
MMTRRGITDTRVYDPAAVQERYGLAPEKLPDFRALRGDTSDNIPGVPGIGDKTASALVQQFGSLEGCLAHVGDVRPPRIAAALEAHADVARRAKELSEIVRDLPIEFDEEVLRLRDPDHVSLAGLFRRLAFHSLLARVAPPPAAATATVDHQQVTTVRAAKSLAKRLRARGEFVVHAVAGGAGPCADLSGLSLLCDETPVVVLGDGAKLDRLLATLRPVLESADVRKVGHDLKRLSLALSSHGVTLRGMSFDTMIAAHLVNPARNVQDLATVVFDYLEPGVGPQLALSETSDAAGAAAAAGEVAALKQRLGERLEELDLKQLFEELEMPLIPVLAEMELIGAAVDVAALEALSARLGRRAEELESDIYCLAGEEFNVGSPTQLRSVLFEKLGLPPDKSRRTKTGYSTSAEALSGLSDHEIVAKILEYREVTKLKSTYVDALPPLLNPRTGRIHTSLNQAVTATGRLSSTNPNLQNIPIRSELGMEIRRAFVAGLPDHLLLSADYSQIELRILAHITEDENLIEIFRRDEDLHRAAAAEIFGMAPAEVTSQMRSFAKMVNFGIPYGISDFRLAREMAVSVDEARQYMDRYFGRFPGLRAYVEGMPEQARAAGHVRTLMGRRRPLPELRTRAAAARQAAERMAINTPMQGSAADIIKRAMLRVHAALEGGGLGARMFLQVHDELLFEVPRLEVEGTAALVEECMSGAYELRVPLKVDVRVGANWLDMRPVAAGGES